MDRMRPEAPIIVVMGVSGAGKTTVGSALAQRLGAAFVEADDYHPEANKRLMASGRPLGDKERWPWLQAVAAETMKKRQEGAAGVVVACSALRRRYRDRLRKLLGPLFFIHLHGDPALVRTRMAERRGHFMPVSLLESQMATLEPLEADEAGVSLDIARPGDEMVNEALAILGTGRNHV